MNSSAITVENNNALNSWIGSGSYSNDKKVTLKGRALKNTFQGWYLLNSKIGNETSLTRQVDGNAVYSADREWNITYNLNGGTHGATHPEKYTRATPTFTLSAPTKSPYYKFSGWTGTGLTSAQETLVIPSGSTGDRSYTANWTEYGTLSLVGRGYIEKMKSYRADGTEIEEKVVNVTHSYPGSYTTNNVIHYTPGGKIVFAHISFVTSEPWYVQGFERNYKGNAQYFVLNVPSNATGDARIYVNLDSNDGGDTFVLLGGGTSGWAKYRVTDDEGTLDESSFDGSLTY